MGTFFTDLEKRGSVFQFTAGTNNQDDKSLVMYYGVDPTGKSLHVGHLVGIIISKRLLKLGGRVVVLIGGGTSQIGDPSGKDKERPILSLEAIEANKKKIRLQIEKILGEQSESWEIVDNADWLQQTTLINFLREVGKEISVSSMLDKDSVKARLSREQGISFAEFSYQLLQAFDYYVLNQKKHANLQIGGSDQWGNIVQGVDLIRRKTGTQVFGLSYPLIIDPTTGKKFGKTESGNAVWLDAELTSPFAFYQFFINTSDELASLLLNFFSLAPISELDAFMLAEKTNITNRGIQKRLAFELTEIVHSTSEAENAKRISSILFDKSEQQLLEEDLEFIKGGVPYLVLPKGHDMNLEQSIVGLGLVSSNAEAKRLISQKGVTSAQYGKFYLIRKGKKEYGLVQTEN